MFSNANEMMLIGFETFIVLLESAELTKILQSFRKLFENSRREIFDGAWNGYEKFCRTESCEVVRWFFNLEFKFYINRRKTIGVENLVAWQGNELGRPNTTAELSSMKFASFEN